MLALPLPPPDPPSVALSALTYPPEPPPLDITLAGSDGGPKEESPPLVPTGLDGISLSTPAPTDTG